MVAKRHTAPHIVLWSETRTTRRGAGHWRFVLKSIEGRSRLTAEDREPGVQGERLELMAVVRGLEALDEPSQVTLVTQSRYVRRGMAYGLAEWRENDWQWERFGRLVPVKHRDLWQRVDRALQFHQVECRTWRVDAAHARRGVSQQRVATPRGRGAAGVRRWRMVGGRLLAALGRLVPPRSTSRFCVE